MNLATALRELGTARDTFPREALLWLRDNWGTSSSAATQVLARCARNPEEAADRDMIAGYFLLHLMAEKGEASAAHLLVALAKAPEGLVAILGDAVSFTLTPMLITLFAKDPRGLQDLVEARSADPDVKACALSALAYLAATGAMERSAFVDWLVTLPAQWDGSIETEPCFDGFVHAIALLGAEDLVPHARAAFDGGLVQDEFFSREEFEDIYALAREEPNPMAPFEREGLGPLGDSIDALERVEAAINEAAANAPEDYEAAEADENDTGEGAPAVNPARDIGRNDPCPCGSGKKYKKCCLAA